MLDQMGDIEELVRKIARKAADKEVESWGEESVNRVGPMDEFSSRMGEQASPDVVDDSVSSELPSMAQDKQEVAQEDPEVRKHRQLRELASMKSSTEGSLENQSLDSDSISVPQPEKNPVPKDENLESKLSALQSIVNKLR